MVGMENKAVLLCRCVPTVRSLISCVRVEWRECQWAPFLELDVIGTLVPNSVLGLVGKSGRQCLGDNRLRYVDTYSMDT